MRLCATVPDTELCQFCANSSTGSGERQSQLVERPAADSSWQMLMLRGALGNDWRSELLPYEVPSCYGMRCAAFTRGP